MSNFKTFYLIAISFDRNSLRRDLHLMVIFRSTLPSNEKWKPNGLWTQLQVYRFHVVVW